MLVILLMVTKGKAISSGKDGLGSIVLGFKSYIFRYFKLLFKN
jgi:hypothetical protein